MQRSLLTRNVVSHTAANAKIVYDVKIVAVAQTVKRPRNPVTMHPLKNVYIVNVLAYVITIGSPSSGKNILFH